ncbi:MarR family winged helix-turn-helix transcriptional regulator [Pannonibacter phragmitetus]|uniref:MarR family winged helix-turn-helix transcriptional regulator n=1 Tax=Pannonibacter phragmitetus TaxID=121719 RepID=UPI003D2F1301
MTGDGENVNCEAEPAASTTEPMEKLDQLIGYNLKRVYILVQNDFRQVLTDDDISPRMFSVLSMSVESAGITQSEVARQLGIERSGLVSIIDDMEKRGLLSRMPVEGDRRAQALHTTEEGRAVYTRALAAVFSHEERIFSVLTPEEQAKLLEMLMRVRRSVEGG